MRVITCPHCDGLLGMHMGNSKYFIKRAPAHEIKFVPLPLTCEVCGKEYIPKVVHVTGSTMNRYCSGKCRDRSRSIHRVK